MMKTRAVTCMVVLLAVLLLILVMLLVVGCKDNPEKVVYQVGDIGPAGGIIFYDCDADNDMGNPDGLTSSSCGWRYLEVATQNLGKASFGYYKPDGYTSKVVVIGQGTEIGSGATNTATLVASMGDATFLSSKTNTSKDVYAAKVCADYCVTVGSEVYDDWFLPSKDEMTLLYNFAKENDCLDAFSSYDYWTSSEAEDGESWLQNFVVGTQYEYGKDDVNYVLPVRAF